MLLKTSNGRNTQQHLEEGLRLSFMWAPRKQMKVSPNLWKKPETYNNSWLFCANLRHMSDKKKTLQIPTSFFSAPRLPTFDQQRGQGMLAGKHLQRKHWTCRIEALVALIGLSGFLSMPLIAFFSKDQDQRQQFQQNESGSKRCSNKNSQRMEQISCRESGTLAGFFRRDR